jgi:hypothetical protein
VQEESYRTIQLKSYRSCQVWLNEGGDCPEGGGGVPLAPPALAKPSRGPGVYRAASGPEGGSGCAAPSNCTGFWPGQAHRHFKHTRRVLNYKHTVPWAGQVDLTNFHRSACPDHVTLFYILHLTSLRPCYVQWRHIMVHHNMLPLPLIFCHCHFVIVSLSLSFCHCHFVIVILSLSYCHCPFVIVLLSLPFCHCPFLTVSIWLPQWSTLRPPQVRRRRQVATLPIQPSCSPC